MQIMTSEQLLLALEASASNPSLSIHELRVLYTYSALFLTHNFRHFDPRIAVLVAELERRITKLLETPATPSILSTDGVYHGTAT